MRNGDPDSPNADDSARRAYNIFVVFSYFYCYLRPIAGSLARREPTKHSSELGRRSLRMALDL